MIRISKIQKEALQRLLELSEAKYEYIARDAFNHYNLPTYTTIPAIDDLSYKEAICIIRYGNTKFNIIFGKIASTHP